jgi:hypothetical protein
MAYIESVECISADPTYCEATLAYYRFVIGINLCMSISQNRKQPGFEIILALSHLNKKTRKCNDFRVGLAPKKYGGKQVCATRTSP